MVWIKQPPNCDCGCGADPCTNDCPCTFSDSFGGTTSQSVTDAVGGQFITSHNLQYSLAYEIDPADYRLEIYANGSLVYDSGCVHSTTVSGSVSIPSGTTSLRFDITVGCGGRPSAPGWFLEVNCT